MSGGRFVLSILAVIVAYSLGVYVLSNWNRSDLRPENPSVDSETKIATGTSGKNETNRVGTKSEPAGSNGVGRNKSLLPAYTARGKKLSSSPVQRLKKKHNDGRTAKDSGRLSDKTAQQDTKPKSSEIVPSFDVIRVEPSGEAVIAGRSEPGWNVRVEAGEKLIGEAKADRDGQWVIVSEYTLGPGKHELMLRSVAPEGKGSIISNQKVQVAIENSKSAKPRIVLAEAGKPEKIFQSGEPDQPEVEDRKPISPVADNITGDSKQKSVASSNGKSAAQSGKGSSATKEVGTKVGMSDTKTKHDQETPVLAENKSEVEAAGKVQTKTAENSSRTDKVDLEKKTESELSLDTVKAESKTGKKIASNDL
ncbi:MAG: hypothetical protein ACR2PH_13635, partial [Desulfobulbia bacterium]